MILEDIFRKLELSAHHAEVYMALLEGGPSSAGHLAKRVNIPRSTLYGLLYDLQQQGLILQGSFEGTKKWHAENPEKIQIVVDERIVLLEQTKDMLGTILPTLQSKHRTDLSDPHFQFFEGKEGVRHILNAPLLYRNISTEVFWPISEMLNVLGREHHRNENRERIRRNIYARVIWPEEKSMRELQDLIRENTFLGVGDAFKREIRRAPKGVQSGMGYWAFKNKVGFVSSRNEGFGFIVQSPDLRKLMKTQFDVLWELSTPVHVDEKYTKRFFEEC